MEQKKLKYLARCYCLTNGRLSTTIQTVYSADIKNVYISPNCLFVEICTFDENARKTDDKNAVYLQLTIDKEGKFTKVDSIKLPKGFIKGSVGAGDAFCAGSLYAIYNEYGDKETLEFANLVAINCLSEKDSISGVKAKENLLDCLK